MITVYEIMVNVGGVHPTSTCGGQKTPLWCQFPPPRVPGPKPTSPVLQQKCLHLLSHLLVLSLVDAMALGPALLLTSLCPHQVPSA